MSKRKKLLIVSDAVSAQTGLARITRDLAQRIHDHLSDVYELATLGYGGPGSTKFPWPQFTMEGMKDWIIPSLPQVCEDFFGEERGIVMFIWDITRTTWFSQPERLGTEVLAPFPGLKEWLLKANLEKWIYCPLDGSGPNDRLTFPLQLALLGFDRILAYGEFGEGVIRRTIGDVEADKRHLTFLPHGIDTDVFYELPRPLCRKLFFQKTGALPLIESDIQPIANDDTLIGIVATNQRRKNWALGIETVAILAKRRKIRLWAHTDLLEKHWSIPALLVDYGLIHNTVVSLSCINDDQMAIGYNACDLVLGIAPEGFGYVHVESMASGTPVITGSYAGGAALVEEGMLVAPREFQDDGIYATRRPIYRATDWAAKADEWIEKRVDMDTQYSWSVLWPRFERWFREGLK